MMVAGIVIVKQWVVLKLISMRMKQKQHSIVKLVFKLSKHLLELLLLVSGLMMAVIYILL